MSKPIDQVEYENITAKESSQVIEELSKLSMEEANKTMVEPAKELKPIVNAFPEKVATKIVSETGTVKRTGYQY